LQQAGETVYRIGVVQASDRSEADALVV
jgi:hypothetical protein